MAHQDHTTFFNPPKGKFLLFKIKAGSCLTFSTLWPKNPLGCPLNFSCNRKKPHHVQNQTVICDPKQFHMVALEASKHGFYSERKRLGCLFVKMMKFCY